MKNLFTFLILAILGTVPTNSFAGKGGKNATPDFSVSFDAATCSFEGSGKLAAGASAQVRFDAGNCKELIKFYAAAEYKRNIDSSEGISILVVEDSGELEKGCYGYIYDSNSVSFVDSAKSYTLVVTNERSSAITIPAYWGFRAETSDIADHDYYNSSGELKNYILNYMPVCERFGGIASDL